MAIDTETKRRSATGIQTVLTVAPVPDGTISAVDRGHATNIYAGIAFKVPTAATSILLKGIEIITGKYVVIKGSYT